MPSTRIYVVQPKADGAKARLVEATTRNAALRHVAQDTLVATKAEQAELVRLVSAGVKVENAGDSTD